MKLKALFAVLALLLGVAVAMPVNAQDNKDEPPAKDEPKSSMPDFEKLLKDVDKVISDVNYDENDMKSFKEHWKSTSNLLEKDDKFNKLKDLNVKEAFDYAVKHEKYVAWAKEKGVDADKFMRKGMRIFLQHIKLVMADQSKTLRKNLDDARAMVEQFKEYMTEEKYNEQIAELDKAGKNLETMENAFKKVPEPTDAEKKLLEANKDTLNELMSKSEKASPPPEKKAEGSGSGK